LKSDHSEDHNGDGTILKWNSSWKIGFDGTGSGSCPVASFHISGVELQQSGRQLFTLFPSVLYSLPSCRSQNRRVVLSAANMPVS
jgi:hypothetical protein